MTRLALAMVGLFSLQQSAFRSGVDLVQVDVSVMRGRTPVAGLTIDNFTLTDNGVPQELTSAALDRLPISATLVLDTSGSVAGEELAHLIDAGQQLVRALRPEDRAGLVTFSERVVVDVPLTLDHDALVRALGMLNGRGATSLNDAIHVAMNLGSTDDSVLVHDVRRIRSRAIACLESETVALDPPLAVPDFNKIRRSWQVRVRNPISSSTLERTYPNVRGSGGFGFVGRPRERSGLTPSAKVPPEPARAANYRSSAADRGNPAA